MLKVVFKSLLVCTLALLLVVVSAPPALAFDSRGGDNVTIPSGEVVEGDLYVVGGDITVDGTINGDLFGVGRSLTVNGKINGGISFAGQTIILNGEVSNGARIAGQSVLVNGKVGRDLLLACSDAAISSQSIISGDLMLGAATARISGRVEGNIKGSSGTATLANFVGKNVELQVEKLTITADARIQGNLTYTGKNLAVIESGAIVSGTTTHKLAEPSTDPRPFLFGAIVVWQVLAFIMMLIIGIVIILIASPRVRALADSVQSKPWESLGWGAVILVVTPIAAIVVMITIIGLPLGLIALLLYGIALYLAQIPVALLIGRLIIRHNRKLDSQGLMIGALALGLFILLLLRLIPFIGWIVGLLTMVFGLGALVTANRRKTIVDAV
jgi:cytoskeletal protein CcmA (bactofilin family)